jgi:hypothetical protein
MAMTELRDHPAKFTDLILEAMRVRINDEAKRVNGVSRLADCSEPLTVLDPFAGVGRIWRLHREGLIEVTAMELEEEWAAHDSRTLIGDSLRAMEDGRLSSFHVIATSPCYANRFADCHDAQDGSERHSYKHDLGRMPSPGSNATYPWGPKYWAFMGRFYRLAAEALLPGGLLLLNVSNFQRQRVMVNAVQWHQGACWGAGLAQSPAKEPTLTIPTPRMRNGDNHEARAESEVILRFRKPEIGSDRC